MAKSQASAPLTYEVNCLIEPGADVRLVVVLHGDALVLVLTLEMVGTVRRDVDQGSDAQGIQHVLAGSMIGTAQVQKGQDLHWATLKSRNIQRLSSFVQRNGGAHIHKTSLLDKLVSILGEPHSTVKSVNKYGTKPICLGRANKLVSVVPTIRGSAPSYHLTTG